MINIIEKEKCCGCGACVQKCPKNCIVMDIDQEGFRYPRVNIEECINCGRCEKVCPLTYVRKTMNVQRTYAVKAINNEIREKSSSGGVFSILAEAIINEGGVVIGAAMNAKQQLEHIIVEDINGLDLIRGSKYIQSDISHIFKVVKTKLQENKKVLFSGTPCQIASLKNYLGHDDKNLICVDIICHGTASNHVFELYIHKIEEIFKSKVQSVNFRYKGTGWKNYSMKLDFVNGKTYAQTKNKDPFLQGFINNLYLRPSCYRCKYKESNSGSDICLGDLWGSSNLFPRWDDNKGISAVLIKTEKGLEAFETIKDNIAYKEISYAQILKGNPSLEHAAVENVKRKDFFCEIEHQEDIMKWIQINIQNELAHNKLKIIWKKIRRKVYALYRFLIGY